MGQDAPQNPHDHELWVSVARAGADRVIERHNQMIAKYDLTSGSVQYHWSIDDATIVWSRAGDEFLRGRITSIGSVNAEKQTWLWSWANQSVPPAGLGSIADVRRYGLEQNFPLLVWPGFQSDQGPVYQATMVALDIPGADGCGATMSTVWRWSSPCTIFGPTDRSGPRPGVVEGKRSRHVTRPCVVIGL